MQCSLNGEERGKWGGTEKIGGRNVRGKFKRRYSVAEVNIFAF